MKDLRGSKGMPAGASLGQWKRGSNCERLGMSRNKSGAEGSESQRGCEAARIVKKDMTDVRLGRVVSSRKVGGN
eukprot:4313105-Lingulodinium_polyedra.AAC.1